MVSNRMTTLLWFLLGISLTLAAVLGVMVLTDDDGGTAASTIATTTSIAATSSTTAETTTTAGPTTTAAVTTTAAPACAGLPSATIPAAGPGVTTVLGDFDADGALDQLIAYQAGDGTFWVQMALSYGYATEYMAMDRAEALAAQSFAEGDAWLGLAAVGSGASTDIIQWFVLDGCTMVSATVDGNEASFIKGGGVMHGDGMICNPDGFTANSAQTSNGTNWEYFSTTYQWDPVARMFHSLGVASSTLVSPADDAAIFSSFDFVCPFSP
jgi:hypothetical protein